MQILTKILNTLEEGKVIDVRIGLHWTAAVIRVGDELRCGLASTLHNGLPHQHSPDVPQAGRLEQLPALELAALCLSPSPASASVGMAALNALLPRDPQLWTDANAEEWITSRGKDRRVVMIGHFPFVERLRSQVGELLVLEQNPGPDDLPAEKASEVLPGADVVAITGMTFANATLEPLLRLCPPQAFVGLLGPSVPLSPVLFEYGVDLISGAVVTAIDPVLHVLSQGGGFRQIHPAGVRLVNLWR